MTKVSEEEIAFLKRKVYSAARDGYSVVICDLLSDMDYRKTTVQAVLNHHSEEEFQYITPLIIASKNGHEEVVDVLLKTFHVDTEETGTVNINGQICNDVTALWCAAATGNFGVVKLLVDNRANITHTAFKHSTPVTVSCLMGRLEILKFLLNHISDKTVAQNNVNDCLLMASSRGHCDIVQYVIQEGADLQFEEIGGNTALHKAAYYGQLSIVQLLVKNGAYMKKNEFNATPLHLAAALGNTEIVEYFISLPECKRLEKIEAFELLGASFTEYDSYDIAKCYHYFEEAMKERYKDSDKVIEKVLPPPVSAYDNKIECKTLTELERIKSDHKALQMESLAVRERIIGLDPLVTATFLINAGVMFYKERDFERCIALWLQALKLSQKSKRAVSLYRFAQIYTEMLQNGQLVDFETLLEVFVYATNEVQLEMKLISKSGLIPGDELPQEHYECNMYIYIYLIIVMLKVFNTAKHKDDMHTAIARFVKLKPLLGNGYSPLHMCCDGNTHAVMFRFIENRTWIAASFPYTVLCKTLISCGAEVNALDNDRNTPLHILAMSAERIHLTITALTGIPKSDTVRETLKCLIKNGAHIDSSNTDGKTALDVATKEDAKAIINAHMSLSLKCLAAIAVKKHKVTYQIPPSLQEFVDLH